MRFVLHTTFQLSCYIKALSQADASSTVRLCSHSTFSPFSNFCFLFYS
jgi:hypothetical protein